MAATSPETVESIVKPLAVGVLIGAAASIIVNKVVAMFAPDAIRRESITDYSIPGDWNY